MNQEPKILVGKFYTAARKFKQLIGQLPDGTVIPGGPYTLTQFVPALSIILLAALKFWLFGVSGFWSAAIQILLVALVAGLTIVILGKVPPTRRSLYHIMSTYPQLVFSSRNGYWNGQPIKNDHDKRIHPAVQYLPAAALLIAFIIKLLAVGTGTFISFLLQLVVVLALVAGSLLLFRRGDNDSETPTENTHQLQPTQQQIHEVTTTKATQRTASGFSRFLHEVK